MPHRGSPATGIRLCGDEVPHSGHICALFDSRVEQYAVIAPYIIDALHAGDQVFNMFSAVPRDEHIRALVEAGVPVAEGERSGQLHILQAPECYQRDGRLDLDNVLELLRELLTTAERDGRCVRACGEMGWVSRVPADIPHILEYEARVNLVLGAECTLLCMYDMATTPKSMVAGIMATHPWAIVNGRLRPNPGYMPPEDYISMLRSQP